MNKKTCSCDNPHCETCKNRKLVDNSVDNILNVECVDLRKKSEFINTDEWMKEEKKKTD